MSMSIGGATVAVVQHKYGAMHCEAFKGKLEAVLQMIDRGDLGGGNGYGCDEHKAALHIIERQIAETRRGIAEQEANDTAVGVTPCQTEQDCEVPDLCKATGGCERMEPVCSRGCPSTQACKAIRSGGECTNGVAPTQGGQHGS